MEKEREGGRVERGGKRKDGAKGSFHQAGVFPACTVYQVSKHSSQTMWSDRLQIAALLKHLCLITDIHSK